jgi:hypothetical protein
MRFVVAIISMMTLLAPAWAQSEACSTATIRGTYSVTCSGYLSPAQGAPQAPISLIGTVKADYAGSFAGTGKVSLGGAILDQTVKTATPAVVNSDCTGTITYIQTIGGQAAPPLNIVFHVLDGGKTILGMSVDTGATMSCTLRLMSYAGY